MSAGLLLSLNAWPCLPPTFITLGADFAVILNGFSFKQLEKLDSAREEKFAIDFCVFYRMNFVACPACVSIEAKIIFSFPIAKSFNKPGKWQAS
jgi:hypothetical protein